MARRSEAARLWMHEAPRELEPLVTKDVATRAAMGVVDEPAALILCCNVAEVLSLLGKQSSLFSE